MSTYACRKWTMELSCTDRIRQLQGELTKRETQIVTYLEQNRDGLLNDTITEFAEKAGVSDATVVRFCRHLGYKGYQDFKVHAARDLLPRDAQYNPALHQGDAPEMICQKIFDSEISVLNRTMAGIRVEALQALAQRIRHARRLLLIGTGGSMNVAKDAMHKFMKIGILPYVYEDMDLQRMAVSLLGPEDLAFAISHSGSNVYVLRCLELAKEKGAYTAALTGHSRSPIVKAADTAIPVAAETTMFQSESASTRIAQLAVIDALVALAAFEQYEQSYEAIQATRQATSGNKF